IGIASKLLDRLFGNDMERKVEGISGKMRDLAESRIWDAPQLQQLDALSRDVGLKTAEVAYRNTFDALFNNPAPQVQAVAERFGAANADELVRLMEGRPQEERARAAKDLALALGEALDDT